jgi:hypothetical protein
MRIAKDNADIRLQMPGTTLRVQTGFGQAGDFGMMSGEAFTLPAGTDTTPLFEGLDGDLCQCPHWGYVLRGKVTTVDARGRRETVTASDLFYWPPGHNVKVEEDAELILFSPQKEHLEVLDHMERMIQKATVA